MKHTLEVVRTIAALLLCSACMLLGTAQSANAMGCNMLQPSYEYNIPGTPVPQGGGDLCNNSDRQCVNYKICAGACSLTLCFIAEEYDTVT